jgi:hypothetical protein
MTLANGDAILQDVACDGVRIGCIDSMCRPIVFWNVSMLSV